MFFIKIYGLNEFCKDNEKEFSKLDIFRKVGL